MHENLDQILEEFKKIPVGSNQLDALETNVWARIALHKKEEPSGLFELLLSHLFPAKYRFVPILCAAITGVILALGAFPIERGRGAIEMLNLKVFKPEAVVLVNLARGQRQL